MSPQPIRYHTEDTLAGHDIIVVGASAGGVEALQMLVAGLPADLPAAGMEETLDRVSGRFAGETGR